MRSHPCEKVGRNDPCPCGSGKKHKHCCLKEQPASGERLWQEQHEASSQLNQKMMKFAARRFGDQVEYAWRDFNTGDMGAFLEERPPSLVHEDQIFMPYFLFHWDPDDASVSETPGAHGGVVARAYIRERGYDLSPMERTLLDQAIAQPVSFYDVLWSQPGERVAVRDILIGGECDVVERTASQTLRQGDIVYGQIWRLPDLAVFGCSAPHCIPPSRIAEVIRLRNILRASIGNRQALVTEDLWNNADIIRAEYVLIRDSLYQPPKLCNTHGDPIVFHTLRFRIESPQAALDALASLAQGRSREELLEDAELDENGHLCKINLDWIKLGRNPRMKSWDNTILGHIKIDGASLIAEVNSAKRAKRLRKEIETRLGSAAVHEETAVRTVGEAIVSAKASRVAEPKSGGDAAKEEIPLDPEARKYVQAMVQQQTQAWVREKIPILGGRTPLEAVRDPDGKEIVESLLLEWERQNEEPTSPNTIRPDIRAIRRLLNLVPTTRSAKGSGDGNAMN